MSTLPYDEPDPDEIEDVPAVNADEIPEPDWREVQDDGADVG